MIVYGALECSYILNCAANFALADNRIAQGQTLTRSAGAFGLVASLAGFYLLAYEFCQDSLRMTIPVGKRQHL